MAEEEQIEPVDEKPWDYGLSNKQRLFLLEMCQSEENFLKATPAYKQISKKKNRETGEWIYKSDETCATCASRWLKKPLVKNALRKLLLLSQAEADEENVYRTIHNIGTLAFYNPADIIDKDGQLVVDNLEDLGELSKCIAQIKQTKYGTEVQLVDRAKYIEMLAKYLNIVRPEVQQEVRLAVVEVAPKVQGASVIEAADAWNAIAAKENE